MAEASAVLAALRAQDEASIVQALDALAYSRDADKLEESAHHCFLVMPFFSAPRCSIQPSNAPALLLL
jgi:hypothetical protein